jgi:hypothetical protein
MPNLSFHEKQHLNRLIQQEGSIKYIFDEFVRKSGIHLEQWKDAKGGLWTGNEIIKNKLQAELDDLQMKLTTNVEQYTTDSWNRSHAKTDDLVNAYIKDMPISKVVKDGMFARNSEALQTFLTRKVDGLTLSERVWDIAKGAQTNIEYYLETGLATGRRADLISQDIRQLLKDPDRRFHRIRNKDGKLIPSQPMKDFHPGQGVYRSSYKNAMRLAVTNTNAMYRQTDCERWSQLDFIKGIKVQRSKSSSYGSCVICDPLAGEYPKNFVFKGWHPWCICFATPILMDEDQFMDALINDDFSNVDYIAELPSNGKEYLNTMIAGGKLKPDSYLLVGNNQFFDL